MDFTASVGTAQWGQVNRPREGLPLQRQAPILLAFTGARCQLVAACWKVSRPELRSCVLSEPVAGSLPRPGQISSEFGQQFFGFVPFGGFVPRRSQALEGQKRERLLPGS